jgi:superfamily II DNA or RNA helicase
VYRPSGLDQLFLGGAMVDGVLRPTTWGELPADERRALHPRRAERVYSMDKVGWLLAEYLPRLRRFGLPVIIETDRLPTAEALKPRIEVHLREVHEGLEVRPDMVYGDPPIARVSEGKLVKLGAAVPVRDHGAERRLERSFHEQHKLWPGHTKVLPPSDAAQFLSTGMHRMQAEIKGDVDIRRFRVVQAPVMPAIDVGPDGEGYRLDVSFSGPEGQADPTAVLHAWQRRQPLVPLMDGGYAPIPQDWLKEHGALLLELWEARDHSGRVSRNATAALVELMEDTEGEAPPDLKRLRTFLEGGEGLPDVELPAAFDAELRPYQEVGFRWLMFLREMDLNGVLADDMGLGKTVQALAALASTPGRHLVVAPTSVLDNWQRESERFWKGVKVCRYHGPQRSLDPNADIVLTSYGLLRMDLDRLRELEWSYLVLDEAQAIKNPRSQTARSAFAMPSTHRLALTGTPVENRLDELWSLFRFLMPGLLGTIGTFRERFVRPMEVGDPAAGEALRKRVRPYVLRRMKRQVAQDLPPLTEVVVRCPMAKEQRLVYDAVRTSARSDVLRGLVGTKKERGWSVQVLEALLRMRQACCEPSLLPGGIGDGAPAAKLDRLEEMLTDLVVEGHKALVFSQFTSLLDRVEPRLEELGIDYVRLDGSTRDRMAVIDRFQDPDGPPVFLLSLKAGGTGLNLTAADYVVHLDPWWNPAVERQATDRAHRIGQTRPVVSYRLIAEDTVEVRILALQEAKEGLAEAALGGEGGLLRALTADEIRMLFDAA